MLHSNPRGTLVSSYQTIHHCSPARRVRASSFAADSASILALRRAYQSRSYTCPGQHPRPRASTNRCSNPSHITSTRRRSTWGCGWSGSTQASWHRSDCKWVRNEGNPRLTPRDKDCPACQEAEAKPVELLQKELLWEQKIQKMRQWVEKDPYDAFFGQSNARLRGLLWPNPSWARQDTAATLGPKQQKSGWAIFKTHATNVDETARHAASTISEAANGKVMSLSQDQASDRTKDRRFDPISMRWVPKTDTDASILHVTLHNHTATSNGMPKDSVGSQRRSSSEVRPPTTPPPQSLADQLNYLNSWRPGSWEPTPKQRPEPFGEKAKQNISEVVEQCPDIKQAYQNYAKAKKALELSWSLEKASKPKRSMAQKIAIWRLHYERIERSIDAITESLVMIRAKLSIKHNTPAVENKVVRTAQALINQRDRPLKHMNANEIGRHRAALLALWSLKNQPKASQTPAEKKLAEEIEGQKRAMFIFEHKLKPLGAPTTKAVPSVPMAVAPNVMRGEGDICPNISKFVNTDRIYKQKAPHAHAGGSEAIQDRLLIRRVREIYESAYGIIDTDHRQGHLTESLSEYEHRAGPTAYTFTTGQDNLEQELKSATTHVKPLQQHSYYDSVVDYGTYTFTAGQDDLEHELKKKTVSNSLAALPPGTKNEVFSECSRYTFTAGQDNLEEELKHKSVGNSLAGKATERLRPEMPVEAGRYTFTTGQDDLEEELKYKSVGNSLAAKPATESRKLADQLLPESKRYTFTAGKDTLEEELKQKPVGNSVAANTEPVVGKQPLSELEMYSFSAGEDNLEEELKHKSVGNSLAAKPASQDGHQALPESKRYSLSTTEDSFEGDFKQKTIPTILAEPVLQKNSATVAELGRYSFVPGKDNLEEELKHASFGGSLAARQPETPASVAIVNDSSRQRDRSQHEVPQSESMHSPAKVDMRDQRHPSDAAGNLPPASVPLPVHHKSEVSAGSDSELYKILSYDPTAQSFDTYSASARFSPPTGKKILSLPDALKRLHSPQKFLPHLEKHQKAGYCVVSANRNILVLRRRPQWSDTIGTPLKLMKSLHDIAKNVESQQASTKLGPAAVPNTIINPVDTTLRRKPLQTPTGNFASPTGFVNHDVWSSPTLAELLASTNASPASSGPTPHVRKEEPVFSGSLRRWDDSSAMSEPMVGKDGKSGQSGKGKSSSGNSTGQAGTSAFRHLAKTTIIVAGCCYVTGTVVEWLRDGPNGGSGTGSGTGNGSTGGSGGVSPSRMSWAGRSSGTATGERRVSKEDLLQDLKSTAQVVGGVLCLVGAVSAAAKWLSDA